MAQNSSGGLLRTRNVLGAALIAGIVAGVYMPPFWNGFGGGSSIGVGIGDPKGGTEKKTSDKTKVEPEKKPEENPEEKKIDQVDEIKKPADESFPAEVKDVVRIVIDDKSFLLRTGRGDEQEDRAIELSQIIDLVKSAMGDKDGIRLRIYRKLSARQSAENSLNDAVQAAKIGGDSVVWIPTPVK